jgi:hypothetical protein
MLAKLPPTALPTGTVTFAPARIAETMRRRTSGLASTSYLSMVARMIAPWLWPMNAMPRPSL